MLPIIFPLAAKARSKSTEHSTPQVERCPSKLRLGEKILRGVRQVRQEMELRSHARVRQSRDVADILLAEEVELANLALNTQQSVLTSTSREVCVMRKH